MTDAMPSNQQLKNCLKGIALQQKKHAENGAYDLRNRSGQLLVLSCWVQEFADWMKEAGADKEIVRRWSNLGVGLQDLAGGQKSEFLEPCDDEGQSKLHMTPRKAMLQGLAAAAITLAKDDPNETMDSVALKASRKLGGQVSADALKKFRRNLLESINKNADAELEVRITSKSKITHPDAYRAYCQGVGDPLPGPTHFPQENFNPEIRFILNRLEPIDPKI